MRAVFVTDARTLEQLRQEFLASLGKRIDGLIIYRDGIRKNETLRAKYAFAITELEEERKLWADVQLTYGKQGPVGPSQAPFDADLGRQ